MRHVIALVVGVGLVVLGVQGAIRMVVNHENAGLLGWVPGGFVAQIAVYIAAAAVGAAMANSGSRHVNH
ncbi:MAG: hypothetical protein LBE07_02195 [Gordonia sp. (in: high G+C Gram-positive bacteria)]|jgi:hypothetical protein|nr:hypothetical protein [Gordonia sp. (in: high G+C Gram-positive bacteria)]